MGKFGKRGEKKSTSRAYATRAKKWKFAETQKIASF